VTEFYDNAQLRSPAGPPWGEIIPIKRRRELLKLRTAWDARDTSDPRLAQSGPFAGTPLTGADVFWLMTDHWRRVTGESISATHKRLEAARRDSHEKKLRELERRAGTLNLNGANLEAADLTRAWLGHASMTRSILRHAHFGGAYLVGATIDRVNAEGANFHLARLEGAKFTRSILWRAHFEFANLVGARFENSRLTSAKLQAVVASEATFREAYLANASFNGARLDGADLRGANFEREWWNIRLPPTDLGPGEVPRSCTEHLNRLASPDQVPSQLGAAVLARVKFDSDTTLANVTIGDHEESIALADARYNGVSLTQIEWPRSPLADERVSYDARPYMLEDPEFEEMVEARLKQVLKERKWWNRLRARVAEIFKPPSQEQRAERAHIRETERTRKTERAAIAARANRQLATALREQGLVEIADYYSYRTYKARQRELRLRKRYLPSIGFWMLKALAGYGYRPVNIFLAYFLTIAAFGFAYIIVGTVAHAHFGVWGAFVYSITAFHGRGVGLPSLPLPGEVISAVEAVIGFALEATFVVVVVQRLLGR
jgi:uncharacterized protein YjbI with pentapeptide repeats